MKNQRTNTVITISIIGVLVIVAVIVFILNFTGNDSDLTLLEKKWISDHTNQVVDVNVFNDIPVYGNGGSGVVFDFLEEFTSEYGIQFNKISYATDGTENSYGSFSFQVLNTTESVQDNQILFYEDAYVLLGSMEEDTVSEISELEGIIGVLKADESDVIYHLEISEQDVLVFEDMEQLLQGYEDKEISYLVVPSMMYLDEIISNDFNILYHVSDMRLKYVLEVEDDSLYSIMSKFYHKYQEDGLDESFSTQFLNTYFEYSSFSEVDKVNYNSSVYTYGYVVNMPYENSYKDQFVGIISNYLKEFQGFTNVDFKVIQYETIEDLKAAILMGDIDLALGNFDVSSLSDGLVLTDAVVDLDYVVMGYSYQSIRGLTSLKGLDISVVSGSRFDVALKDMDISTKGYADTDDLLRNLDDNSIFLIDKATYQYYKDGKLKNYMVLYEGSMGRTPFVISSENTVFNSLFSFYVSLRDYHNFKNLYQTNMEIGDNKVIEVLSIVAFCILFTVVLLIVGVVLRKKRRKKQKIGIDDKTKFIDMMTSLKNRNYLNYSIPKWDENVIYPQAIVVIDLNNLKDINDIYGHEKGDEVIKSAANILIANQLEKTDLVRTDGNEFLIYMVGYDVQDVVLYARKIYKEFKTLPYGFGASIGYSMIEDDVKTIDDAINEAVIEMNKNKDNGKVKG